MNVLRHSICIALSFAALAPASAKTLTIGIDLSGSSPVTVPKFAKLAATAASKEIAALKPGDFVYVRTIGDRGFANIPFKKIRIDRRNSAKDVAALIGGYIAALPSKPIEAQGSTHLLSFLTYGREFGCASGDGKIWLITDGIEHSELISSKALLSGGALPNPKPEYLAGCSVTFFPLGATSQSNISSASIDKMQAAWETYFKIAGASFDPVRLY